MEKLIKKKSFFAKTASAVVSLCMIASLSTASVFAAAEKNPTWDGQADTSWYNDSSTEFTITTGKQLAGISELVENKGKSFEGKTIKLGANIVMNDNAGEYINWTTSNKPTQNRYDDIGNLNKIFKGTFDGQGHVISGLYAYSKGNGSCEAYNGLFVFNEGTIKNLGIVNSFAHGGKEKFGRKGHTGMIAGVNKKNGVIENCYVIAKITGTESRIGGLVGLNEGSIKNSYALGSVQGKGEVGGLVGKNDTGDCRPECLTHSSPKKGHGNIVNSYCANKVVGNKGFGIVGDSRWMGGHTGHKWSDGDHCVFNSFFDKTLTPKEGKGGLSTAEMKKQTAGGTFTVNKLFPDQYPYLQGVGENKITFKVNGKVYKEGVHTSGTENKLIDCPKVKGCKFDGWYENGKKVEKISTTEFGDRVFEARFTDFEVKFVNYDDSVIETQTVKYGEDATEPTNVKKKPGYVFDKWSEDFTNVTKPLVVKAEFKKAPKKTTVVDNGDDEIPTTPTEPAITTKPVTKPATTTTTDDTSTVIDDDDVPTTSNPGTGKTLPIVMLIVCASTSIAIPVVRKIKK